MSDYSSVRCAFNKKIQVGEMTNSKEKYFFQENENGKISKGRV